MNRRIKLENYFDNLITEHTEPFGTDTRLLVTDAQLNTVGRFFLEGMVGLIESLRAERPSSSIFSTRKRPSEKRRRKTAILQEDPAVVH